MFKKFFGKKENTVEAVPLTDGFSVIPTPMREGGSFRIAGTILFEDNGVQQSRPFIRADSFQGQDEAISATVNKAQQIINEQGQGIFSGDLKRPL